MNRSKSLILTGLVLASCLIAANGRASSMSRIEYLTMSRATSLPGVVLPAGNYKFEVIGGHVDVVRVTDRLTGRVLYLGFTDVVEQQNRRAEPLTFGEAPNGAPVPIKAWFPDGTRRGNVFRYR